MVMCSFESSLFDHRVRLSTLNDASFWLVWHFNVAISHCFVFETCSYLFQFVDVHIGIFCTETFLRQSVHISLFKLYLSPHLFICTSVHLCIYTSLSCFLPLSPSPSLSLSLTLTLSHSRSPSQSLALSLSLTQITFAIIELVKWLSFCRSHSVIVWSFCWQFTRCI